MLRCTRLGLVTSMGSRTEARDPFGVLGLPRTATLKEVKARYRLLAKQYHPDNVGQTGGNAQAMENLNRAYHVLVKEGGWEKMHVSSILGDPIGRGVPQADLGDYLDLELSTEKPTSDGKFMYFNRRTKDWVVRDQPLTSGKYRRYQSMVDKKRKDKQDEQKQREKYDLFNDMRRKKAEQDAESTRKAKVSQLYEQHRQELSPTPHKIGMLSAWILWAVSLYYIYKIAVTYVKKMADKKQYYQKVRDERKKIEDEFMASRDEASAVALIAAATVIAAQAHLEPLTKEKLAELVEQHVKEQKEQSKERGGHRDRIVGGVEPPPGSHYVVLAMP